MSRRAVDIVVTCFALFVIAAGVSSTPAAPSLTRETDALLEQAGLDAVLAASLHERLEAAGALQREALGERLAEVYARLLESSPRGERERWLERSRALLASLRGLDAPELRLALAIALYESGEPVALRSQLLLAQPEEELIAAEDLLAAAEALEPLADRLDDDLDRQTRLRRAADSRDRVRLDRELREVRRWRSLARYYAGWSRLQRALLVDSPADARAAVAHFAAILDADDESPDPERLPRSLLDLDHVARSVLGLTLALDASGQTEDALRWLEAVEPEETRLAMSAEVREQFDLRSISLRSSSGDWFQLGRTIRARGGPLPTLDARLLAVVSLRASEDVRLASQSRDRALELAEIALGDLVERNEFAHIVDLLGLFEHVPDLGSGFAGLFVRGLQRLGEADRAQLAEGGLAGGVGVTPTIRRLYEAASRPLLEAAAASDGVVGEAASRRARYRAGVALHGAGLHGPAAQELARVAGAAGDLQLRERALWLAIVTLDTRISAAPDDAIARRDRDALARDYLADFSGTERAVRLVVRLLDADLLPPAEVRTLLRSVDRDAPTRRAARTRLADLLYGDALRGVPGAREELASLAREALDAEAGERSRALADDTSLVLRRALAVLLDGDPPAARSAVALLDAARRIDLELVESSRELVYRSMQVAVLLDDERRRDRALGVLLEGDDRFAGGALRFVFRAASDRWRATPTPGAAAALLDATIGVLDHLETAADRAVARTGGAAAAVMLAGATTEQERRAELLTVALRFDRAIIDDGLADRAVLERAGRVAMELGEVETAIEIYQRLQSSTPAGTDTWFAARVQLVGLLVEYEPERARALLEQHEALYPQMGPPPWGERLRALGQRLSGVATQTPEGSGGTP